MTATSARQRLSNDHRDVNEVLKQLLTALQNKDVAASYTRLDLLWARLAVHIRAEHLHLFPALIGRLPKAQLVVEKLRTDHDFFMTELARAVAVLRKVPTPLELSSVLDVVLEVDKRLANHNEIEENQIYRWASTILTEPEQIDLAARIAAELENRPSRFSVEAWANND
jgi:hypothetical protein